MDVDVGNNLPNLKITVGNTASVQDDEFPSAKSPALDCILSEEIESIEVVRKPLVKKGFRVYENKGGAFITGIDLSSEAVKEKLIERAARFGLEDHQKKPITHEEIETLYKSLDIGCEDGKSKHIRLDAIHVRGVQEMSTDDVIDYFKEYGPAFVEWINDFSCNVAWLDEAGAARALLGLSKVVVLKKKTNNSSVISECEEGEIPNENEPSATAEKDTEEVIFMSDLSSDDDEDDDNNKLISYKHENAKSSADTVSETPMEVDTSETAVPNKEAAEKGISVDVPIPPGHWRLGIPHQKAKAILLRFATKDDKKLPGAEKRSTYYQKYGNPNYGGMTGLITTTRKRKFNATKHRQAVEELSSPRDDEKSDVHLRKKASRKMRMRMHADDEEERVRIRNDRKHRNIENNRRGNVHDRLGDFAPRNLSPVDLNEYPDYFDDRHEEDQFADHSIKSTVTQTAATAKTSRFNVWNRLAESMARDSDDEESQYVSSRPAKDLRLRIRSTVSNASKEPSSKNVDLRLKLQKKVNNDSKKHRSILSKDISEDSDG